jgi:hypothetical protein
MRDKRRPKPDSRTPLPVWPTSVMGGKYVRILEQYVRNCRGDEHGNRELFLDDVFVALLLAFFNPTLRTLPMIEDFSQTQQAQRFLSIDKLCRSTLSDFNRLVDPELLRPLIAELGAEARKKLGAQKSPDLPDWLQRVVAVDGSFFRVAADVAWAFRKRTGSGRPKKENTAKKSSRAAKPATDKSGVRLDVHLDVAMWLPVVVDVSGKDTSEAEHAAQHEKS